MPRYELTKEADADLEEIIRYTLAQWGESQAEVYVDALHNCFENISSNKVFSRPFSENHPEVYVIRCESHYVFYLSRKEKVPRIFAVLHERMDLLARLKDRLE